MADENMKGGPSNPDETKESGKPSRENVIPTEESSRPQIKTKAPGEEIEGKIVDTIYESEGPKISPPALPRTTERNEKGPWSSWFNGYTVSLAVALLGSAALNIYQDVTNSKLASKISELEATSISDPLKIDLEGKRSGLEFDVYGERIDYDGDGVEDGTVAELVNAYRSEKSEPKTAMVGMDFVEVPVEKILEFEVLVGVPAEEMTGMEFLEMPYEVEKEVVVEKIVEKEVPVMSPPLIVERKCRKDLYNHIRSQVGDRNQLKKTIDAYLVGVGGSIIVARPEELFDAMVGFSVGEPDYEATHKEFNRQVRKLFPGVTHVPKGKYVRFKVE